jgi:hypothetical protein
LEKVVSALILKQYQGWPASIPFHHKIAVAMRIASAQTLAIGLVAKQASRDNAVEKTNCPV